MNGRKETHSMALVMVQSAEADIDDSDGCDIPRLKREEMKNIDYQEVPLVEYQGPKKPNMPVQASLQNVQPLKVLAMGAASAKIAKEVDFEFFKDIITNKKYAWHAASV